MQDSLARIRRKIAPYAFVLPAFAVLFGVLLFPLGYSLYLSLFRFSIARPFLGRAFVGLGNYIMAFRDAPFLQAIKNTLIITFSSLTIELIIGTGIAVMLNTQFKLESFFERCCFPVILSYVVVAVLWRIMLS